MGSCSSIKVCQDDHSMGYQCIIPHHRKHEQKVSEIKYKCMLAGTSGVGKTAIFNRIQMKYIGYTELDRQDWVECAHENALISMKTLIYRAEQLDYKQKENCTNIIKSDNERKSLSVLLDDHDINNIPDDIFELILKVTNEILGPFQIHPDLQEVADRVLKADEDDVISSELAHDIKLMWNDNAIKTTFANRSSFQISDYAPYYFDRVELLSDANFIPSKEHLLRLQDRTTHISSDTFFVNGNRFDLYDVGGRRCYRKHWINVFKDLKAFIDVVDVSAFDKLYYEDEITNCLDEALKVFSMICNSRFFQHIPVFLIFNKIDIFKEKVLNGNFKFDFEFYDGPQNDPDKILEHIVNVFKKSTPKFWDCRGIYTFFINEVDDDFDFTEMFDEIVRQHKKVVIQKKCEKK